ncbi:hypothetical protein Q5752_000220 [Cryptotrichosporon argae]
MSMASGQARRGKPKIRPPPKRQETSIKDTWAKLAAAIREIQNHNASKLSFEEHYRYAYNMVLFKHGDTLYSGVKALIAEHLEHLAATQIVPTFPRSSGTHGAGKLGSGADAVERVMEGDRFLKAVKGVWEDHTGSMRKLQDILKYMDKVYTSSAGVPVIYDVGLALFLKHIVRSATHPIHTHLLASLLSQVQLERDGEQIPRSTVRECVDVLLRLQEHGRSVYVTDFEREFLKRSREFYEREAAEQIEKGDAGAYLRNVERRLAEEADRTAHYLSTSTSAPLQFLLVDSLLTAHLGAILDMPGTGLSSMLDADRLKDLRLLYALFLRVPNGAGKEALRVALRENVDRRGKAINESAEPDDEAGGAGGAGMDAEPADDAKGKGKARAASASASALTQALRWVQDVLDLKDKFDAVLAAAFNGDMQVQTSLNEAFQSFINAHPRAAEFLSLYIDEHLKKGSKAKGDDEIEAALEKTIVLFRFLADKDKFERYYKNHLAKRLLYGKSVSDDAERGMVAKLKVEMGFQFTLKLEGMFTDMRVSSDMTTAFHNHLTKTATHLPFDLQVNVLTSSHWPPQITQPSPLTFPSALTGALSAYHKFYDSKHSGRRLTWQGAQGTADVRVRFKARAHDLVLSTTMLVVLLLFDDDAAAPLAYADIQAATELPDAELERTLQSLACGKYRVLAKSPKGREVGKDDRFAFNDAFTCPLARVRIAQVASRVESTKEREETQEMVDEERKHQIEACIVRIMKARKTMGHNDLISEVAHQLASRFVPSMGLIKKRIESLIDRDYLERMPGDIGMYQYLA